MVAELIVGGDLLEVGQDLRLVGERLAPPRVQRVRVGVEVRRHIASGTGIGVVAPGAAEAIATVEDREVVTALVELNAHRDAARACADDRDLRLRTRHLCNHYIYSVMRNDPFVGRSWMRPGPNLRCGARRRAARTARTRPSTPATTEWSQAPGDAAAAGRSPALVHRCPTARAWPAPVTTPDSIRQ